MYTLLLSNVTAAAEISCLLTLHASRYLGDTYNLSLVSVEMKPVFSGFAPLTKPYALVLPSGKNAALLISDLLMKNLSVIRLVIFAVSLTVSF